MREKKTKRRKISINFYCHTQSSKRTSILLTNHNHNDYYSITQIYVLVIIGRKEHPKKCHSTFECDLKSKLCRRDKFIMSVKAHINVWKNMCFYGTLPTPIWDR